MPPTIPASVDASIKFEDLSGIDSAAYANPYDALIEACDDDPVNLIQARYATHRTIRNSQQKAKLLSSSFAGLSIDTILQKLDDPTIEPGFTDPRHCLVFWARPPTHIRALASDVQQKLLSLAPKLWLMPPERMHLTALEVTHSLTDPEIQTIIAALGASAIEEMTDYTFTHRARLVKPMVSYDGAALALSFLPAAGEGLKSSSPAARTEEHDKYTYHHLRRDLFAMGTATGVTIDSRYVVPSSHITLARFLHQDEHDSPEKMTNFLKGVEELNAWLEKEVWGLVGDGKKGEWVVGQEKGLDCREGQLWYGGGTTVRLGKGF